MPTTCTRKNFTPEEASAISKSIADYKEITGLNLEILPGGAKVKSDTHTVEFLPASVSHGRNGSDPACRVVVRSLAERSVVLDRVVSYKVWPLLDLVSHTFDIVRELESFVTADHNS